MPREAIGVRAERLEPRRPEARFAYERFSYWTFLSLRTGRGLTRSTSWRRLQQIQRLHGPRREFGEHLIPRLFRSSWYLSLAYLRAHHSPNLAIQGARTKCRRYRRPRSLQESSPPL